MRERPPFSPPRYTQGLAAYRSGHSIADIVRTMQEIERMHDKPDLTDEEHWEIAASGPSLAAGFLEGALEDLRLLAGQRRGLRA